MFNNLSCVLGESITMFFNLIVSCQLWLCESHFSWVWVINNNDDYMSCNLTCDSVPCDVLSRLWFCEALAVFLWERAATCNQEDFTHMYDNIFRVKLKLQSRRWGASLLQLSTNVFILNFFFGMVIFLRLIWLPSRVRFRLSEFVPVCEQRIRVWLAVKAERKKMLGLRKYRRTAHSSSWCMSFSVIKSWQYCAMMLCLLNIILCNHPVWRKMTYSLDHNFSDCYSVLQSSCLVCTYIAQIGYQFGLDFNNIRNIFLVKK